MSDIGIIGLILIIVNVFVSFNGFKNTAFFEANKFEVDSILISKEYKRLITSGFLHVSWTHLIFNMVSLAAFSVLLENHLGEINFLLIYFASLIGGDLLALFVHRHHGGYSSVGASGAVCGAIFASIALFPDIGIGFFIIPFSIPGWLYGIIYVLSSIYGIKSQKDNIGHEAHLGGALVGMLFAITLKPDALVDNYITIMTILLPAIAFIYLIITKPQFLLIDNYFFKTHHVNLDIDHRYNARKIENQKDLDRLLDKIHLKGIDSLSAKEKLRLEEYSEKSL